MPSIDVLIFVEDPGAANYVAQLPATFAERGWCTRLLADGYAKDYLLQRGVYLEVAQHPAAAKQILASVRPRLLIIGTSENEDTLGLKLVAEARSAGIESVGVVDAPANAEYRFRGRSADSLAYAPDWLLVPDEWTKAAYVTLGYPIERVVVCGHPRYDEVRATGARLAEENRDALRRRLLPGATGDRRVVVFATEVSTGLNPQQYQYSSEYTLTGRGKSTGRTEIVLEEFLDAIQLVRPRPYLVLRLHPKNTQDDFMAYLGEFDLVSSDGSPLELIYVADLVVGLTSMLLLEAALLGRPTLSVVPRTVEMEWLPSIHIGATACVTTREQLRFILMDLLRDSLQGQRAGGDAIPYGSLQRTVEFVEKLLERAKTN